MTNDEIIDAFGGTGEVARLFEIDPASVSGWRKYGIPKGRLKYLRLLDPNKFILRNESEFNERQVSA